MSSVKVPLSPLHVGEFTAELTFATHIHRKFPGVIVDKHITETDEGLELGI